MSRWSSLAALLVLLLATSAVAGSRTDENLARLDSHINDDLERLAPQIKAMARKQADRMGIGGWAEELGQEVSLEACFYANEHRSAPDVALVRCWVEYRAIDHCIKTTRERQLLRAGPTPEGIELEDRL